MTKLRNILILGIIVLVVPIYGQEKVFINDENIKAKSVYIDNNRNSKLYDQINYWKFRYFDDDSYQYSLDYLYEHKIKLIKKTPVIFATKWITLKQYKGKFYAYYPSDFCSNFKQSINDTTFIDWLCDGIVANKIIDQKQIDSNTYEFNITGIYHNDRKIVIHIIDKEKGIAVFEETTNSDTEKYYYLMISSDKIRSVPLIVNDFSGGKQLELRFDKPDFEKLLKTKK
ncbi:MAG: hypothetical protein LBV69_05045 [Bacteroidales bacterium]|jgi:hypothetical protein|nr:hypothetical protein [Bacteroidales bacterium]